MTTKPINGTPPHSAGNGGEQTRASSAGGEPPSVEQRARELLAAEFERDGLHAMASSIREDIRADLIRSEKAVRAIAAALRSVEQPSTYSLDADPLGIRARAADAITGALAYGAQNTNPPPSGHWLTPFWEMARAEKSSAPCPCGQSTCVEPWEPGCGLGNSEQHAIAVPEPVAWRKMEPNESYSYTEEAMWPAKYPNWEPLYAHPAPLRPVTDEDLTAAVAAWTAHETRHPKATLDALILTALESHHERLAGEGA